MKSTTTTTTTTTTNTHREAAQSFMVAKFIKLTHKIVIQLHLVAESHTICSSCFRQQVQKLLDTPSYMPPILYHFSFLYKSPSQHFGIQFCKVLTSMVMKKDYEYLTRLKMAWRHITARFLNSAAMN
jgi:hypothetical protein